MARSHWIPPEGSHGAANSSLRTGATGLGHAQVQKQPSGAISGDDLLAQIMTKSCDV